MNKKKAGVGGCESEREVRASSSQIDMLCR